MRRSESGATGPGREWRAIAQVLADLNDRPARKHKTSCLRAGRPPPGGHRTEWASARDTSMVHPRIRKEKRKVRYLTFKMLLPALGHENLGGLREARRDAPQRASRTEDRHCRGGEPADRLEHGRARELRVR